jgi:hypothetical protein
MEVSEEYWETINPPPNLHIHVEEQFLQAFVADYQTDSSFASIWNAPESDTDMWKSGYQYFKNEQGLIFF